MQLSAKSDINKSQSTSTWSHTMKYKLQDLIDMEHFQNLQDRLNEIYSFPSSIIDNEGNILTATAWQDICTQFHRKNKDCEKLCIQSDLYIKNHIHEANPAVTYQCPHGLVDNATPIIIDGVHYGNFFTGQFFLEKPDMAFFRAQAHKYEFDTNSYLEAVERVPIWTQEQLNSYLFFIKGLIAIISESGLKKLKEGENRKRIESSEKRHRSILKSAMDGYWLTDTAGQLLEVNGAYCRMSGYSEDELLMMRIPDLEVLENPQRVAEHIQKVISQGSDRFETKHRSKDGTIFEVEVSIQFRSEEDGQCVCFLRDITDQKNAEKALQDSETKHRKYVENSPLGIFVVDEKGKYVDVNPGACELLGYTQDELIKLSIPDISISKEDRETFQRLKKDGIISYEGELKRKEGSVVNVRLDAVSLPNGQFIAFCTDITERKQTERLIRNSQKKYRTLFENMAQGVFYQRADGVLIDFNNAALEMFGLSSDQFLGRTSLDPKWNVINEDGGILPGDKHPSMVALQTGEPVRNYIVGVYNPCTKDYNWLVVNAIPQFNKAGEKPYQVFVTLQDITNFKRSEKELRESEKELQLTLDATADGIWSWCFKTNELYFSSNYYKMLGYMPDEFPANFENWINQIHKDDKEKALEVANEFLKQKPDLYNNEFRMRTKNGDYRWMKTSAKVVERDENGDAVYMIGNHEDITEKKLALDALIKGQARFELAMRSVNDGLWDWNVKTNEIYFSPAWKKMLGYEDYEIENKFSEWERLTDPKDVKRSWGMLKEVFEGKRKSFKNEFKMRHKAGHWVDILARADVINDENGEGARVIGTHVDITERKRLEEQLQQSQKMESIGTLAGGIAHDFNNILFPIVGYTEMLMEDVPENSPFKDSLNEIYNGALRARDLVQQILAFSRQGASELNLIRPQTIVKEALKLIRATIPTTISLSQNIQSDCNAIKADPTKIHQIVMNLTTNAYHAMENDGGELKVVLKEVKLGQQDLKYTDLTPGRYACLTISDTGIGITKDVIDKIFDPFFTTKEKGKGTGMGLSVVHGIIKNMNGKIEVDSELGKGTEFHVYLPIVENAFKIEESPIKEPMQGGDERILLVDDEEIIIKMETKALERLGYQVTSLTSSIEALEIFRTNPDKFDLIVTDMAMPKIPGNKLAAELIKIRPDIPILLCTGFSEAMTEEKVKSLGIKGLLLKPIIMKELARKIRETLDNT